MTVRLTAAICEMAAEASMRCLPKPVIHTDPFSAMALRRLIDEDCGGHVARPDPSDCVAMFDGVKIKVYREPDAAWRGHFGPLAEAFGDAA